MTFYDTTELFHNGSRKFHAAWTEAHDNHVNITPAVGENSPRKRQCRAGGRRSASPSNFWPEPHAENNRVPRESCGSSAKPGGHGCGAAPTRPTGCTT